MAKSGRDFEKAVYEFAQAINPNAKVIFDHSVPDRETGDPRQCDVWIEALVGDHWLQTINVSCKDHKRKLHTGDLDTFIRETESRSATMGVIYSRGGFTAPALRKAKKNGISCCMLFENKPADIPEILTFRSFACQARLHLGISGSCDVDMTWSELFDRPIEDGDAETFVQSLVAKLRAAEQLSKEESSSGALPRDFVVDAAIPGSNTGAKVELHGTWQFYEGLTEAHFLDGSYCFESGRFHGSQATPAIDTQGNDPGPGWRPIARPASLPASRILAIKYGPRNLETVLRNHVGTKRVGDQP